MEELRFQLRDGGVVFVREVRPEDRPLFEAGEKQLSAATWRARFLMPRDHLEEAELDYLTHPDGETHVALGAVTRDEDGTEGPVAVARYLLIPDEGGAAECAIVVVDAHQGRGVGRVMAETLMRIARSRRVREFRCEILPDNDAMKTLMRRLAPQASSRLVGSLLHFRVPLDPETTADDAGASA